MSRLYVPKSERRVIEKYTPIDDPDKIIYKCPRCGAEMRFTDLQYLPSIKCINCGYRILYKVRAPGSKIIEAI